MTGVLLTTIVCLLMLCAVLVALVIGQDREATRQRARATSAETRCARQRVQIRHQRDRINGLRSEVELLGLACDRLTRQRDNATSLLTADLATLPTTHEREYPR